MPSRAVGVASQAHGGPPRYVPAGRDSMPAQQRPRLQVVRFDSLVRCLSLRFCMAVGQQRHGAGHAQAQRQGGVIHGVFEPLQRVVRLGQAIYQPGTIAAAWGPPSARTGTSRIAARPSATSFDSGHLLILSTGGLFSARAEPGGIQSKGL